MSERKETVFLSLGSNLGDREHNLRRALAMLEEEELSMDDVSSIYETEPVGYPAQPWFLNLAARANTALRPRDLLATCQRVEHRLGRARSFTGAPREIDIDILLYGDLILHEGDLVIPHPRLAERRFVLVPLAEIGPNAVHPSLGATAKMLAECADLSAVRLYFTGGTPPCRPT